MKATIIGTTIIAMGLSGYWFFWNMHHISTENAYVETDLSPVNSRMMGFVREIYVAENDVVKKGQKMLKFDDVDSKLELSFKKAKLEKAKADALRAEKMHKQHAISDADYEMAQATVAGFTTEVEGGELKLMFTEIVAPTDGIVAKRTAQIGQFVQPGQSLFVIVPTDHAWIKAAFKETQIRHIKAKQKVDIKIDAYPGETWQGEVEYLYPSSVASMSLLPPENATGNFTKVVQRFPIHVSFTQKESKPLLPGMSAEVIVRIE
jgi:membrane fusion protein, multidrug efflux system